MEENSTYFEELEKSLPKFLKPSQIVKLGICGSTKTLNNDRDNRIGLTFIKLPNQRVVYPREMVISYLKTNLKPPKFTNYSTKHSKGELIE